MKNMHETEIFVRFYETDAAGHISHISYFLYIEEARAKFFESIGFGLNDREEGLDFIVATTKCDYIAQGFASQTLKVLTTVSKTGNKSITINHEIRSLAGQVLARGSAVIVCFNYIKQESIQIPDKLRTALEQYIIPV